MKTVVLGVCSSIAAYKSPMLVRALKKAGLNVRVVLTKNARELVAPLALERTSENPVALDMFSLNFRADIAHISLATAADVMLIAPATANAIGKMAHGIADDLLTTTVMAAKAPLLIAPAMNENMYLNAANQDNMALLRERGAVFVEPGYGDLACGVEGIGRLAELDDIVEAALIALNEEKDFAGKRVLVTAGPTREAIDPVRYITNHSSGKMGYAIAREAVRRGAEVTLISGRTALRGVYGAAMVYADSTQEMYDAVLAHYDAMDVVIKAAAPADFTAEYQSHKIKKEGLTTLHLQPAPDILEALGQRKGHQFLAGFAAETGNVEAYALQKLKKKNLDVIVANDVSAQGTGFDVDTNEVTLYDGNSAVHISLRSKDDVAKALLHYIAERLSNRAD